MRIWIVQFRNNDLEIDHYIGKNFKLVHCRIAFKSIKVNYRSLFVRLLILAERSDGIAGNGQGLALLGN